MLNARLPQICDNCGVSIAEQPFISQEHTYQACSVSCLTLINFKTKPSSSLTVQMLELTPEEKLRGDIGNIDLMKYSQADNHLYLVIRAGILILTGLLIGMFVAKVFL